MISRCPDDFKHCKTALDHLVMMQHYGAPTRLLDITENPLVALYFACKNEQNMNGKVDIFKLKNENIKRYNSDTAAIIANLAKIDYEFNIRNSSIYQIMKEDGEYFHREPAKIYNSVSMRYLMPDILLSELENIIIASIEENESYLQHYKPEEITYTKIESDLKQLKQTLKLTEENSLSTEEINSNLKNIFKTVKKKCRIQMDGIYKSGTIYKCFTRLIIEEKPYFDPDYLNFNHLESVICIKPKHDNPHIIKQNGEFFLFGLEKNLKTNRNAPQFQIIYTTKKKGKN